MKKFTILAICILLVAGLAVTAFAADADIALAANAETVKVGEQIVVTLSVSNLPDATSGSFKIDYPEDSGVKFVKKGSAWLVENIGSDSINAKTLNGVFVLADDDDDAYPEPADINGDVAKLVFDTTSVGEFTISVTFMAKNGSAELINKTATLKVKVVCAEHAYGDFVVTTPAECGKAGEKTATCSVCGDKKTEAVAALEHTYGDFVETTPAKCGVAGVKTATCSACGDEKTEAIAALEHAYGDFAVTTEPKCGVAGEKSATCSACGDVKTEAIAALEHAYGEFVVVTPATETSVGKQEKTCSACGDVVEEEIPMLETTPTEPEATEPEGGENPPTGDSVAIIAITALVVLAGVVIVFKKRSFCF